MSTKKNPFQCSEKEALQAYEHSISKQSHTPTPWVAAEKENCRTLIVSGGPKFTGETVGVIDRNVNAAFIVRSVNSHEELLTALKRALMIMTQEDEKDGDRAMIREAIVKAEAKAEGGTK